MVKFEFSAGGIVYKQSLKDKQSFSSNKRDEDRVLILVAQHSQHHGWVFPKGLIGDREDNKHQTKEETAVREVKEETGIDAEIIEKLSLVTYWYMWEGEKRKKTVYYYLMRYKSGNFAEKDHEMEAVEWLPIDKVMERLTYKSDKEVWKAAKERIPSLLLASSS